MRIRRERSRVTYRNPSRRRSSCLSFAVLLGVVVNVAALAWAWFGGRLPMANAPILDQSAAAQQAFDRGDLDAAIEFAKDALVSRPDNAAALTTLTRALVYRSYADYHYANDRDTALEWTSEAVSRYPNNLHLLAAHAFALQAVRQPGSAARIAEQVLQRQPENALARTALALAYGSVGSFEIALRESLRATQSGEWHIDSLRALAISYSDIGDYENAVLSVQRAINEHPRLTLLYFERALYALQLGDAGAASVAYFQVLAYEPENVKVRLRLCELSSLLAERDAAIDYCQQVTERAPTWSDGWYQLGWEYFLKGDFATAQRHLHQCSTLQARQGIPIEERRFECWYLQGQAAEILGDCPALIATYNEFRTMAAVASVPQTWTYPPEGPPGCV